MLISFLAQASYLIMDWPFESPCPRTRGSKGALAHLEGGPRGVRQDGVLDLPWSRTVNSESREQVRKSQF